MAMNPSPNELPEPEDPGAWGGFEEFAPAGPATPGHAHAPHEPVEELGAEPVPPRRPTPKVPRPPEGADEPAPGSGPAPPPRSGLGAVVGTGLGLVAGVGVCLGGLFAGGLLNPGQQSNSAVLEDRERLLKQVGRLQQEQAEARAALEKEVAARKAAEEEASAALFAWLSTGAELDEAAQKVRKADLARARAEEEARKAKEERDRVPKPERTASALVRAGRELAQQGHLEEALKVLEQEPADGKVNPDLLLARGATRWLLYVRARRGARQPLSKTAAPVQKALQELGKADTAQALLLRGQIEELTGDFKEARTLYESGLERFPEQNRLFQTALDRLDTRPDTSTSAEEGSRAGAGAPGQAVVHVCLADDPAVRPPTLVEVEAEFYAALKKIRPDREKSRKEQYEDAGKKLEEARRLLASYADFHPGDAQAQMLLRCFDQTLFLWRLAEGLPEKEFPLKLIGKPAEMLGSAEALAGKIVAREAQRRQAVAARAEAEEQLAVAQGEATKANGTLKEVAARLKSKPERDDLLAALDRALKTPAPPARTAELLVRSGRALFQRGQLGEALKVLEQEPADKKVTPDLLAARGEVRWLLYVRQQRGAKLPLSKKDRPVDKAVAELTEADTAEALLLRGQIEELAGDLKEARALYESGLKRFPEQKLLFQTALDRLDTRPECGESGA